MVKVYSIPNCPWCQKLKKYLSLNNIDFTEVNVEDDEAGRDELFALTNQLNVPVAQIEKNVVIGFNKEELDTYLNLNQGGM
ncbi:glutaredoxin domain-containing protein [Anaerosinus massiliensis]|uniref:glutaredoxin domain-containing protein n=1 Tax=Massilibacillus massiliensis TaxID=1806837 RepID=UPI000DA6259D|nr:glutaredoxin domain-containing protein [Massilibacillus massiliensis]